MGMQGCMGVTEQSLDDFVRNLWRNFVIVGQTRLETLLAGLAIATQDTGKKEEKEKKKKEEHSHM